MERRTQMVSASTSCDTHAPLAMNASATAACRASSRVITRSRMFVSTARMLRFDVLLNALLQLFQCMRLRRLGKQRPMNVLRRVSTSLSDEDLLTLLVPFEYRPGTDPELPANLDGN